MLLVVSWGVGHRGFEGGCAGVAWGRQVGNGLWAPGTGALGLGGGTGAAWGHRAGEWLGGVEWRCALGEGRGVVGIQCVRRGLSAAGCVAAGNEN